MGVWCKYYWAVHNTAVVDRKNEWMLPYCLCYALCTSMPGIWDGHDGDEPKSTDMHGRRKYKIYIYILHYSCYASEVTAKKEKFTLVQSVMWLRSACTTISIGLLCKIVVSFFSSCFLRTISSTSRSHIFVWVVQNMYFNQKHHTNLYASLVCRCSLPLGLLCPSGEVAPLTSFTIRWNA